jgi:hypothetical protein
VDANDTSKGFAVYEIGDTSIELEKLLTRLSLRLRRLESLQLHWRRLRCQLDGHQLEVERPLFWLLDH